MSAAEKVVSMDQFKKEETVSSSTVDKTEQALRAAKDVSRVALVVSLLSVVFAAVVFFMLNKEVTVVNKGIASMGDRVDGVEVRMAELNKLPAKSKRLVIATLLAEMTQKASYLEGQVDAPEEAAKLTQAVELLKSIELEGTTK